ncbi:hypothetical protein AX15_005901 [Amanita polypyramis BW_CC]|nr:hypothetical protein AX15_005901 [Amanita polypyramis BW_CC]
MLNIPVKIFKKSHKRRELYIAYYYRTPTLCNPVRYHSALVSLPSPALDGKSDSEAPSEGEGSPTHMHSSPPADHSLAIKFHAVNVPLNENGRGRVLWKYRVEKEDPHVAGTHLRTRLVCLMRVGAVSSNSKLEKALKKVEADKYADEHPNYVCSMWLCDALSLLVEEKMIDPLASPPAEFWEIGARYADNWKEGHHSQIFATEIAIPCCDKDSKELPTPMGPVH